MDAASEASVLLAKACLWTALGAALLSSGARGDTAPVVAPPPKRQVTAKKKAPPAEHLLPLAELSAAPPSSARAAVALSTGSPPPQLSPPLVVRSLPVLARAPVDPFASALVVAGPDDPNPEPSLAEAIGAAARLAAGEASQDASRMSRARAAHWAPVVRGQAGTVQSDHTRDGIMYQEPLHWTDQGAQTSLGVTLTWDLPSTIYARDENQLALSSVHLARVRRDVSVRAAQLYGSRQRKLIAARTQPASSATAQLEAALGLLEITAELDALTGGLFAPALERTQARVSSLSRSLHLEEVP